MKKKMAFLIFTVFLLGVSGIVYLQNFFFPVKVREILIQKAEALLHRTVRFDAIQFHPIKGFIISNLNITEKDDPARERFVHIDQVSFNVLYLPFFKEHKIIVPHLDIQNASVELTRLADGQWNFADLLTKDKGKSTQQSASNFLLAGLSVSDLEITVLDKTLNPPFLKTFEQTNVNVSCSANQECRFALNTKIPNDNGSLTLQGSANLSGKNIRADLDLAHIQFVPYLSSFFPKTKVQIIDGQVKMAQLNIQKIDRQIRIKAKAELSDAAVNIYPNKMIKGSLQIPNAQMTIEPGKSFDFQSSLAFNDAKMQMNARNTISGDLKTPALSWHWAGGETTIQSSLNLNQAVLTIGSNKIFSGQAALKDGAFNWKDGKATIAGQLTVNDFLFRWADDKKLQGQLNVTPTELSIANDRLNLKGPVELLEGELTLAPEKIIKGHLMTARTSLITGDMQMDLVTDFKLNDADITWPTQKKLTGAIDSPKTALKVVDNQLNLTTDFSVNKANLAFERNRNAAGDPQMNLQLQYVFGNPDSLVYQGTLQPHLALLAGMPRVNEVKNVSGQIHFKNNELASDGLTMDIQDTPVRLTGTLSDFKEPFLDIQASSDKVEIEKIVPFLPEKLFDQLKAKPSGQTTISISFKGKPSSVQEADFTLTSQLQKAKVALEAVADPFTDLEGTIRYSRKSISWKDLKGQFKNIDFLASGQLDDFARPQITTTFRSKTLGMDLTSQLNFLTPGLMKIESLAGKYQHSDFDLTGDVFFSEKQKPDVELKGNARFNLQDLSILLPQAKDRLEKLAPKGSVQWEGSIKGNSLNWMDWLISSSVMSPEITLSGYKINDLAVKSHQANQQIDTFNLTAHVYNGDLNLYATADLFKEFMPYQLEIQIKKVDLEKLKTDTIWKDKIVSGSLSSVARLNGALKDPQRLEGQGSILINDGNIWQLNLFTGLGKLLLIPEYEDIIFNEASLDYLVKDGRITTENLILKSEPMILKGKGWMNFAGEMDFNVVSEFNINTITHSESIKKTITALIAQSGPYLNIKVSGSLKAPKYALYPSATHMINTTKNLLLEGLKNIF